MTGRLRHALCVVLTLAVLTALAATPARAEADAPVLTLQGPPYRTTGVDTFTGTIKPSVGPVILQRWSSSGWQTVDTAGVSNGAWRATYKGSGTNFRAVREATSSYAAGISTTLVVPTKRQAAKRAARSAYAKLTAAQRVGQLFMLGLSVNGPSQTMRNHLKESAAGNWFMYGNFTDGVAATRRIVDRVNPSATQGAIKPFVAVDQEGGTVQHLQGPGFDRMPSAVEQGKWSTATLRSKAATWARQLRRAGITVNLAPVADTVPRDVGTSNAPIGALYRQYGSTTKVVGPHVVAFLRGMHDARLASSLKHFPGLGRATGNTDYTADVVDPTTANDPYLKPFAAGIAAGSEFVMMSSARYPNIDNRRLAVFSPDIMRTLLRQQLGFRGVVISDDLSGAALRHVTPADRAVRYLAAGGTVLLDTRAGNVHVMAKAIRERAAANDRFAGIVKQAVLAVLTYKALNGLMPI